MFLAPANAAPNCLGKESCLEAEVKGGEKAGEEKEEYIDIDMELGFSRFESGVR